MRPREADRFAGDSGQVAGVEVLPFGLLVFVIGSLLITNVWGVVDAKFATDAAAREAVRAYVEAPSSQDAERRAEQAARSAITGHGRDPDRLVLLIEGAGDFRRCSRVRIEAGTHVPAIALPWIGGFGNAFDVRSSASEVIDPYRSGLPGEAAC